MDATWAWVALFLGAYAFLGVCVCKVSGRIARIEEEREWLERTGGDKWGL